MLWAFIAAIIAVLDQATKQLVLRNITSTDRITVIDGFFYLIYRENTGAAWSLFPNGRYFFLAITPVIAGALVFFLVRSHSRFLKLSLSLILGGAAGNFIDRAYRGSVVDFFDFHFGSYVFPTFNVADTFVVVGTILLSIYMLFIYKEPSKKPPEEKGLGES